MEQLAECAPYAITWFLVAGAIVVIWFMKIQ